MIPVACADQSLLHDLAPDPTVWKHLSHCEPTGSPCLSVALYDRQRLPERDSEWQLALDRDRHVVVVPSGLLRIRQDGSEDVLIAPNYPKAHLAGLRALFAQAINHAFAIRGGAVMHGAAFEAGATFALALAVSRGGKSTLVAVALRTGGRVVSDDLVCAGFGHDGRVALQALRRDLYLREPTDGLLPEQVGKYLERRSVGRETKAILRWREGAPSWIDSSVPTVIYETSIDRRRRYCQVVPMSEGQTLAVLLKAGSPLFFSARFPEERARLLPVLLNLAQTARGFRVKLGRDIVAEPEQAFSRLLDASRI